MVITYNRDITTEAIIIYTTFNKNIGEKINYYLVTLSVNSK